MENKYFSPNHVPNTFGKMPGSSACLNPFLIISPPHLPKLFNEETLIPCLLRALSKLRVYHIHIIIVSLLQCLLCKWSVITGDKFFISFHPKTN